MARSPAPLALLIAAGAAACAAAPAGRDSARAAALVADRAMSAACVARDRDGFLARVAPDALFVGKQLSVGRDAVGRNWAPLLAPGGPELSWEPVSAEAAPAGDLVLTLGSWRLASRRAAGGAATGRYATVWRREADGKMRAVLDGDAAPLPPLPPSVVRQPASNLASADGGLLAEAGVLLEGGRAVGRYLRVRVRDGAALRDRVDAGSLDPR